MSWVKQTDLHRCAVPMSEFEYTLPDPPRLRPGQQVQSLSEKTFRANEAAGQLGDLWRCDDCGRLWRIGYTCGGCDAFGRGRHDGQCAVGYTWRPGTLWQRLRNRRKR